MIISNTIPGLSNLSVGPAAGSSTISRPATTLSGSLTPTPSLAGANGSVGLGSRQSIGSIGTPSSNFSVPGVSGAVTPSGSTSETALGGPPPQTNAGAAIPNSNQALLNSSTITAQNAANAIGGSYTQAGGYVPGSTSSTIGSTTAGTGATPAPTLFSNTVGSLANTSQNGSTNATNATQGLLQAPDQNAAIAAQAQQIGSQYGNAISKISNYGQALGGSYTNGAGLAPVSQGLAGVAQNTTANEIQGQEAAENAALAPLNQELTAQNQAQSGLNEAGSTANTQQSNVQSGLTNAGTLAKTEPTAQGQTTYNPVTNSFSGGSYQDNLATIAQDVSSGNMGYSNGVDALKSLSPTAAADLLSALGSNFDTVKSDAAATARGTNIGTAGTATTSANATGLANSIQQETELNTAAGNATSLAGQVTDALKSAGLNMTNSTDANTAINNLQSRLGNSAYTQLNIAVNDARNAYAAILTSMGSTPTDAGNAASQNINSNMSPSQILGAISQLNLGVGARQSNQHQQTLNYQNQLNGSGGAGSGTGTGPVSYNF